MSQDRYCRRIDLDRFEPVGAEALFRPRHVVYVAANLSTDLKDYIVDTIKLSGLLREKP
jgi:uncharacterized protein YchJ